MTGPDYAARAAAGAAFLDERRPGWAERIDLDTLALYSECDCVLGQLGGHYDDMRDELALSMAGAELLGFTLPMDNAEMGGAGWHQLDAAWIAEITKRREHAQVTS